MIFPRLSSQWLFCLFVGSTLTGFALLVGCGSQPSTSNAIAQGQRPVKAKPGEPAATVRVELPQGAPLEFSEIPCQDGMTVLEVMNNAVGGEDGLKFIVRGQGETAFVTEIAGHKPPANQGWIFLVNGEESGQGIGARKLKAGDQVLWKIGTGQ